jgi:RecA-family ATPase
MNKPLINPAFKAFDPIPKRIDLVDGIIGKGKLIVLVADGGSLKTISMMDLGVCLSMENPWLGTRKTIKSNVLFIDEETTFEDFSIRLKAIMTAHNADMSIPFFYVCNPGFDFYRDIKNSLAVLESLIKDVNPDLVIIDSLMDVLPGADENSTKDMTPFFKSLKSIINKTGTSIIVIHHVNKKGNYRGSSSIRGHVDLLLKVEKKGKYIEFSSDKTRYSGDFKFSAEYHFEPEKDPEKIYLTDRDNNSYSVYDQIIRDLKPTEKIIIQYLAENGVQTKSDIESIQGRSKRTLTDSIYQLQDKNLVERVDFGGQGTPATFGLSIKGYEIAIFQNWINDPWLSAEFSYVK